MIGGYVLAGGRSTRMGVDKARVPFPDRWPMAVHLADVLGALCPEVSLVRRAQDGLPWVDRWGRAIRVIEDVVGDEVHPLWGVVSALRDAEAERVLVVPCDVPFLEADDLRALLAHDEAVASDGERVHPLVCVLRRERADAVEAIARAGGPARALADDLPRVALRPDALRNVNRWADTGRPGPVRALLESLPWLDEAARARVEEGEVGRLAARGCVDPER